MEKDSLERKVLAGDHEAFKQWMNIHIQNVERFAVQYGLTPQDAGKVAETVFRNLYNDLGQLTKEQLEENALFKSALQNLKGFQVEASEVGLFPFEEDNQLLQRLIDLPNEARIAFILSRFNEKSIGDIAWITETLPEHVDDLLQNARAKLDGPDIEKRLEFLATSINRLRPTYDERNIFYSKPKEALPIDESVRKAPSSKRPLLLWLSGAVMLILILSIAILRSDAYERSAAERFIENKRVSFQQDLDERFELIGLAEPDENEQSAIFGAYRMDIYGNDHKRKFERYINTLESQLEKVGKVDTKEATKRYNDLIYDLRLPSEMIEQLKEVPLVDDREQSLVFLDELAQKNDFLSNAYMAILANNANVIWASDAFVDGMVDIDKFLEKKSEYPIELQKAIDGMETQFYYLATIKDVAPLLPKYGTPELKELLHQNLHPDMSGYIFMVTGGLDILYEGSFSEQVATIIEVEKELPKTRKSDQLSDRFDSGYTWLLYSAAGFMNMNGIYDRNFAVKVEVRERWKRIAAIGENSPAGQLMQEIVDEMEASNWTSAIEHDIQSHFFSRIDNKIKKVREGFQ
ncbi:RNA polymerase sigma factor [Sporosarcina sp. UB5]|uniref:RNA polymerase sigma factor n=1 Tax=Sporosarcina sp. UB5 TaxID=3047463 RepID=UPI003D79B9FF